MEEFIQQNWVSIIGTVAGLVFLYLEYKANVWMWAASIVMAGFYIYIFYDTKLYASMVIYTYFLLASIYGWIIWIKKNRDRQTGDEIIKRVPKSYTLQILIAIVIIAIIIYYLLIHYSIDQSYITIGDALTTSLNIVALWMVSRKWAEQWLLVIPANAISAILLFIQKDYTAGTLFVVFFVVSIFGYYKWKKMAKESL